MIGLLFKRTTRVVNTERPISNAFLGVACVKTKSRRSFASSTVVPALAMASTQEQHRPVGKKFVIACDGESPRKFRFQHTSLLIPFQEHGRYRLLAVFTLTNERI